MLIETNILKCIKCNGVYIKDVHYFKNQIG